MTVMFVDIEGSTEMSSHHEPEVVRDVTRRYQEIAAGVIRAHGGYVAQYAGDGVLAYFGFPAAREDDARRAVLGALELRDRLHELAAAVRGEHGVELGVRIGLHTGVVLHGDMGSPDAPWRDAIVGLTPNQAAGSRPPPRSAKSRSATPRPTSCAGTSSSSRSGAPR